MPIKIFIPPLLSETQVQLHHCIHTDELQSFYLILRKPWLEDLLMIVLQYIQRWCENDVLPMIHRTTFNLHGHSFTFVPSNLHDLLVQQQLFEERKRLTLIRKLLYEDFKDGLHTATLEIEVSVVTPLEVALGGYVREGESSLVAFKHVLEESDGEQAYF